MIKVFEELTTVWHEERKAFVEEYVTISIDMAKFARSLAKRALKNKHGTTALMNGIVKAKLRG
jgi:hypothetical protein